MANYNSGTRMFYTRPDGQTYCFSPVPLLAEGKEYIRNPNDGSSVAIISTLTFNGVLLPTIPALSGVNADASCIELLDRKSDQLSYALEQDRGTLLIVDASGYTVLNVRPKITSLNFDESQIVNHRRYSIVFEYESDYGSNRVREYEQTWSFQQQEDDTVAVSHAVSALGIYDAIYGASALSNAKTFVLARANNLDKTQSSFLQSSYVNALVAVNALTGYNHVRSENSDINQGRYDISETWLMASGNYKDDRTIDRSWDLGSNNTLLESITVNGTVQGYGDTTFEKYDAAVAAFDDVVAPEIGFYTGVGITNRSLSKNRFNGQVNYSLALIPNNAQGHIETRGITRSIERNEDGSVTQTVTTSAKLRAGSPSGIDVLVDFVWSNNEPINFAEPPFSASLSGNIETIGVQRDEIEKSLSLTRAFRDQSTANYREEYEISRTVNADTSLASVTINGTVVGLSRETGTKTEARFVAASGAYFNTIQYLSRDRCLPIVPSGFCVGNNSVSSTLGINRQVGTISYSETYDSRFLTSNANIRDEQIEVNFTNQSDVIAEIGIPGKDDGPILQDQETLTGLQKSLKIQYTMAPSGTGGACSQGGNTTNSNLLLSSALTESNILVNNTPSANARGEKPESSAVFKVQDEYSWNRQSLLFSRNVTWKYLP